MFLVKRKATYLIDIRIDSSSMALSTPVKGSIRAGELWGVNMGVGQGYLRFVIRHSCLSRLCRMIVSPCSETWYIFCFILGFSWPKFAKSHVYFYFSLNLNFGPWFVNEILRREPTHEAKSIDRSVSIYPGAVSHDVARETPNPIAYHRSPNMPSRDPRACTMEASGRPRGSRHQV